MKNENILIIEAGRTEKHYWADIWRYRELFYILSWRDVTVRYKQTAIGIVWAILRPLLTITVFTVIFGKLAKFPSDGNVPYAIMVCAAMLPWQFFASSVSDSSNSLIDNTQLITKVYFPRIIIPISSVVTSSIDFLVSFVILVFLMVYFKFTPGWNILFLPIFLLIAFLTAAGVGLYITALNVKYRDFRYIVPFLVQFGFYVSPVGFSSSIIPEKYRLLYSLNPMVGVIDGFRWAIMGNKSTIYLPGFLMSIGVMLLFLILGIYKFRKMEKTFADII
ncbi:MAG: ABC transporter permease [Candidatus Ratteibacteria bacterium]|jgi:lipopolysaccharide transport system permease protein